MPNKRKKLSKKEEDKVLQELKNLYLGTGSQSFTFEHGNTNQKDSHDFKGYYAFREYYQELILLLFLKKSEKPSQKLYKLLDYNKLDDRISYMEKENEALKKRFLEETVYPEEFAQYAIADQNAYRDLEAKTEEIKRQRTNEINAFYNFFYDQINTLGRKKGFYDKDRITERGLYDCWCYLKKALKLKKGRKREDPREYILETIIFAYNKGVASFNTNYNKFFYTITSAHVDKNFSNFLNDFAKKNKIKKLYSSHLQSIPGLTNTIYASSLYNGEEEDLEEPQTTSRKEINMFRHQMYASNKKKYGGTTFLKTCLEQKDTDITGDGDYLDYKTFIDKINGKTHCETLFYYKKYDLAVLHEQSFSRKEKTDKNRDIRAQRRHFLAPPDTNTILSGTTGVKEGGFVLLIINKRNSHYWSRFFRDLNNHEAGPNLSIETIIPFQDHVWLILRKTKQAQAITFFDGEHFIKQMINTNKGSEVKAVLDYESFIGEYRKTNSPHRTKIKYSDLVFSRFNLTAKRWFMPSFAGKPLSSFTSYYYGERPSNKTKKIKMVDVFTYPKKSSGGLDYKNIPWTQMPPGTHKTTSIRKINKSCLLINLTMKDLNPVWFEYENKPIYINPRTIALEVDNEKALGLFLEFQLLETHTQEQLKYLETNRRAMGYSFNEIKESLKIKLPSLKKQQEYINEVVNKKIKKLIDQAEEIKRASGLGVEDYVKGIQSDIDWLDHAIALPIGQLNAMLLKLETVLYKSISKKDLEKIQKSYKERYEGKKLDNLFKKLFDIGDEINEFVQYAGNRSKLKEKETKPLDEIIDILQKYNDASSENTTIEAVVNIDKKLQAPGIGIRLNEQAFKFMINEVIKNASKHGGFSKDKQGKITIEMSNKTNIPEDLPEEIEKAAKLVTTEGYGILQMEEIIISIKNNGAPMPFGKEDFVKRGKRGDKKSVKGKGNGGAEIGKIAEDHCLRWDIIKDPVEFVFIFDLKFNQQSNG